MATLQRVVVEEGTLAFDNAGNPSDVDRSNAHRQTLANPRIVGTAGGQALVRFLQPVRAFVLSNPRGVEIPVQLRVEPHADNRAIALSYCDGASAWQLDGAGDSAVQPIHPLTFRIFETCRFVATVLGPGGRVRARAVLDMRVCGGLEACDEARP